LSKIGIRIDIFIGDILLWKDMSFFI